MYLNHPAYLMSVCVFRCRRCGHPRRIFFVIDVVVWVLQQRGSNGWGIRHSVPELGRKGSVRRGKQEEEKEDGMNDMDVMGLDESVEVGRLVIILRPNKWQEPWLRVKKRKKTQQQQQNQQQQQRRHEQQPQSGCLDANSNQKEVRRTEKISFHERCSPISDGGDCENWSNVMMHSKCRGDWW